MIYGDELKDYVQANPNLVRAKESTRYPGLYVLKYQNRVFFDSLWNDVLKECRGLVVDSDFNPVIKPFTKVKNRYEDGTNIHRDTPVLAVRKINGFMAAATQVPHHGWVISTTGSLDSEFADMAKRWLPHDRLNRLAAGMPDKTFTWLFEIVDPADPHIIPEEPGAYLIGMRFIGHDADYYSNPLREALLDRYGDETGFLRPQWREFEQFSDLTRTMNAAMKVGWCMAAEQP